MFFNRSYHFVSSQSAEAIRQKLLGRHTSVHGLDFEVMDTDHGVRIVPHAEELESIKTLPVTRVEFKSKGVQTDVKLFAHMRRIDQGGPTLIVIFSLFMVLAGIITYFYGGQEFMLYITMLIGIGLLVFIILWVRLETGYFDYIRKVRKFVKEQVQ